MTAFSYLNKKSRSFIQATNLKAISKFSGIGYTLLYSRLNTVDYYEDDETILFKGPLIKGQQRLKKINGQQVFNDKGIEVMSEKQFSDFFDEIKR